MKALGIKQFHQMKHKLLDLEGNEFRGILGKAPEGFVAIIYGNSGNGKTEFTLRLTKSLALMGKKVAWVSYEQRHDFDLQLATKRNNMEEVNKLFYPIDPTKKDPNVSYLEDLDNYLSNPDTGKIRRSAPSVIVIDSLDYTGWNWKDYTFLKEKYSEKIIILFIAHSTASGRLEKDICRKVLFDGGQGYFVSNYIARRTHKNRFGATEEYIIWEERARELDPLYFERRLRQEKKASKPKKSKKATE